jgi:hypothetical protein
LPSATHPLVNRQKIAQLVSSTGDSSNQLFSEIDQRITFLEFLPVDFLVCLIGPRILFRRSAVNRESIRQVFLRSPENFMEGVSSQRAVKNRVKLDDGQNLDVGEHNIYWVCLVQHVQGVQDFNVQCDEELKKAVEEHRFEVFQTVFVVSRELHHVESNLRSWCHVAVHRETHDEYTQVHKNGVESLVQVRLCHRPNQVYIDLNQQEDREREENERVYRVFSLVEFLNCTFSKAVLFTQAAWELGVIFV